MRRRQLLDALFERDGQTLNALAGRMEMTRFGVMKHLGVLEQAGLVVTRRAGREKLHYLNLVPIRDLHDRWISKYVAPWVGALTALRDELEQPMTANPHHVFQIYVRCSPEQLCEGITSPDFTRRYFYGTAVQSTWEPGAAVAYLNPDGSTAVEGEVVSAEPPFRLTQTWRVMYDPAAAEESPSRVTWEIEQMGETCRLTMTHDQFPDGSVVFEGVGEGWPMLLSSLKSLIETDEPLNVGA
ncbi:MAG: SRPBCC domain-containing protein [Dehalococcoidia bacterium]|nr:SRPBCC domain-containing protein [Dehalococcoidia bacterium]